MLVRCPECQKEISDKVASCIHCGCPLAQGTRPQEIRPGESQQRHAESSEQKMKVWAAPSTPKRIHWLYVTAISAAAFIAPVFLVWVVCKPRRQPAEAKPTVSQAATAEEPSIPAISEKDPVVQAIEQPPPVLKTTPEIIIDGEVFIVTRGGQSIKFGLVEIGLIPMELLEPYIKDKKKESDEARTQLAPQIEEAKREADRLGMEVEQARQAQSEALDKDGELRRQAEKERMWWLKPKPKYSYGEATAAFSKVNEAWYSGCREYRKLLAEERPFLQGPFYFDSLPASVRKTKTNSDGKYHIVAPKTGLFALAAKASRLAGDSHESYFWLLKIDPVAGANQTTMLSNDNLTSSGAPESLIHTPE